MPRYKHFGTKVKLITGYFGMMGVIACAVSFYIGTAWAHSQTCFNNASSWTETRLFFGRDIGDTGEVSAEQWRDFTVQEIIPRFGDGFTVIDAAGYWQGESCRADNIALNGGCEKTKVLLVQYPPSSEADAKLKAIAQAYITRFSQEAVMRSDTPVCTQFITPKEAPE